MNIPELKKSMERYKQNVSNQDNLWAYMESSQFILDYQALLSACQLLCDAIEKGKIDIDKL